MSKDLTGSVKEVKSPILRILLYFGIAAIGWLAFYFRSKDSRNDENSDDCKERNKICHDLYIAEKVDGQRKDSIIIALYKDAAARDRESAEDYKQRSRRSDSIYYNVFKKAK